MPNLMDIAKISVNKKNVTTPYKAMNKALNNNVIKEKATPKHELNLKNKLKTEIQVINEETKQGQYPKESFGIFASWNDSLNRQPLTDEFKLGAINKVKVKDEKQELQAEIKAYKLSNWLKEVDQRIKNFNLKA